MTAPVKPQHTADADHRFFVYCPMDTEFYYFATAADRDRYSDSVIQTFLDDGWDELVENVVAGELSHVCVEINREDRPADVELVDGVAPDGTHWGEWDYRCNYALQPLVEPAAEGGQP